MYSFILLLPAVLLVLCVGVQCGKSNYTENELAALEKFRPLVADVLVDDYQRENNWLIRWLRVQNFNMDAAVRMLKEAQKWRKENNIDTILNETILEFREVPYTINGIDFEGSPVIIFTPAQIDPRKWLRAGQSAKLVRYWDQILEDGGARLRAAQKAMENTTAPEITQVVSILDLHGFNVRQHLCLDCIRVYVEWVTHFEKYHPDSVKYFVMLNAPRAAVPLIEIIKNLMSPRTRKGFRVFDTNKKVWSQFLLKIIPADQLTYRFGGTRKE